MESTKLPLKKRILKTTKKWLMVFLNPRLLLCLFIAWMITNGWSYVFATVGFLCDIPWMAVTGSAYMSLLWVPFTPEKIITVIIAIFLMRLLFPRDEKTIGTLKEELRTLKAAVKRQREKRKQKRELRKNSRLQTDAK